MIIRCTKGYATNIIIPSITPPNELSCRAQQDRCLGGTIGAQLCCRDRSKGHDGRRSMGYALSPVTSRSTGEEPTYITMVVNDMYDGYTHQFGGSALCPPN